MRVEICIVEVLVVRRDVEVKLVLNEQEWLKPSRPLASEFHAGNSTRDSQIHIFDMDFQWNM